jgi:hypothetical protein
MNIVVCDDFLNTETQDEIERVFLGAKVPWYFYANVNYASPPPEGTPGQFPPDDRFRDASGFASLLFPSPQPVPGFSSAKTVLEQFLSRQGFVPKQLIRIKANLLLRSADADPKPFTPHVDLPTPHWVVIYYVNDSDGDTIILDKTYPDGANAKPLQAISPKKGRAVFFDGNHYHCGTTPSQHETRCVLNFDFL